MGHGGTNGDCTAPEAPGLRERKKLATREAICHAAIRQALANGLEHVRVPDVAAEAGVSPRTFNNYFSSITEAICALPADRARSLGDALRSRPPDENLAEAMANAMMSADPSFRASKDVVRMIVTTPALRAEFWKIASAREADLARAIADRLGARPQAMGPALLAAAYTTAARVVTTKWLSAQDETTDYPTLLRDALDLVAPMAAAYEASYQEEKNKCC